MKDTMLNYFNNLNQSKYVLGIALIAMNIGSKFLLIDLSTKQEEILKNVYVRRFTLFAIFFVGSRDLTLSLLITACWIVLSTKLIHEDSKFNLLPKNLTSLSAQEIKEKEEYEKAKVIVDKYNERKVKDRNNVVDALTNKDIAKDKYFGVKKQALVISESQNT